MTDLNYSEISIKRVLLFKLKNPSILFFIGVILFTILTYNFWIIWVPSPFSNDVDQYYSYLTAEFIHHDLDFKFPNPYWLIDSPTGQRVPKVTMGMAIMYLPFFLVADNIAYIHQYDGLGYSPPYSWLIHFGSIFYVIIGLWYSRKTLLLFFNKWITAYALVFIFFATNLFYYTYKESEMTHGYLFCLISVFLYHVIKWRKTKRTKHVFFFSIIAGLITLIRPTEILVLLIPLLIEVVDIKTLKERVIEIWQLKYRLLIAVVLFLIPILPQLIFWKVQTGQFFFFSYGSNERFFFNDPQFYNVLFGWKKGWLIYSPVMIFSVIGMVMMFFKAKKYFLAVVVYFIINLYFISSWWDWGYGGAYGMRALVQSYAILIIPFAYFFNYFFLWIKKPVLRWAKNTAMISLCVFFCYLTMLHTYLLKSSVMHWDSMSKEAYWFVFMKTEYSQEDRVYLETVFDHPNYDDLRSGKRD